MWLILTVFLLGASNGSSADVGTVKVTVKLESDAGWVYCALHGTAKTFPGDAKKAVATARVKPKKRQGVCLFEKVPLGPYALAAYHDSNGNGELDTNWVGIPSEGTAATNDAKGSFGPPKFEDARFVLTPKGFVQTITMSY